MTHPDYKLVFTYIYDEGSGTVRLKAQVQHKRPKISTIMPGIFGYRAVYTYYDGLSLEMIRLLTPTQLHGVFANIERNAVERLFASIGPKLWEKINARIK